MPPIDYRPLKSMDHAWHQVIKNSFGGYGWIVSGIILTAGAVLMVFAGAGVLILIGYAIYIGAKLQRYEDGIWRSFAAANGWNILPAASVKAIVPPTLQTAGNSRRNGEAVRGNIGRQAMDIFWFQFTIGSGKDSHSYPLTIARLQMNTALPHMLLRAQKALTVGDTRQLKEKLQLEGDFNKYFKVFVQPGAEVEDLVILTPDVMQFLIAQDPAYNIEILDNSLFVIGDGDLRRESTLSQLIDFSLKTQSQIMQNLPVASASQTMALAAVSKTEPA